MVAKQMYFDIDEYRQRWAKVNEHISALGYGVAVILQRSGGGYDRAGNVWYLTNYASLASGQESSAGANAVGSAFAAVIMRPEHEPELHISEPEHTVERRYVAVDDIYSHSENFPGGLASRLVELGVEGRVAFLGEDFFPVEQAKIFAKTAPSISLVPEEYLLYHCQIEKSPRELELFRKAGEISSGALTVFMEALIRGERQCDAAADAASIIIRNGGGFQRVCCHTGKPSELSMWDYPLYGYSTTRPKPGDMVRAWVYGPIYEGYWVDPGRSSVCGRKPAPEQRRLIEDTVDMTEQIIGSIRSGSTPRDAGIIGDEFAERRGYGQDMGGAIWDLYGHGLSTYFHGPIIPSHGARTFQDDQGWWNVDRPFQCDEVFTVETFVREPGVGMASFEEILIVKDGAPERLTTTPMIFW